MNKIFCGECAQTMREIVFTDSVDLTITSPPYDKLREYEGFTFDFNAIAAELWRVTKPGGVVVWVVADATVNGSETGTSFRQALGFMGMGFRLHDTMIYQTNKLPQDPKAFRYHPAFEYMFIFSKNKPKTFNGLKVKNPSVGKKQSTTSQRRIDGTNRKDRAIARANLRHAELKLLTNIWNVSNSTEKTDHPAPFPEALARDHIISWSNPGDVILDPMCGSGTTLKMAVEQGRQYIGIDISKKYCELSRERVVGAKIPLPGLID